MREERSGESGRVRHEVVGSGESGGGPTLTLIGVGLRCDAMRGFG